MGNCFSVSLFQEHSNDTVPETIVTVKSYGLKEGQNSTLRAAILNCLWRQIVQRDQPWAHFFRVHVTRPLISLYNFKSRTSGQAAKNDSKWRHAVLNFGPLWRGISVGSDTLHRNFSSFQYDRMWPVNMTGKVNIWPVKPPIRPDIVRWPAVISSPVWR